MDRHNRSYFGLEFSYCTIPNELVPFDYQTFEAFPGHVEAGVTNLRPARPNTRRSPPRTSTSASSRPPAPCPSCFRYSIWTASPIWTEVRPTRCPTAGPLSRGATGWWSFSPSPGALSRKPERLLPLIQRRYREYPNFCRTMEERPERDNRSRAELFQLEKEGKALVIAPNTLHGVGRIEHNVDKLRMLWAEGYQQGMGEHGARSAPS